MRQALIIEDEPSVRHVFSAILTRAGFETILADRPDDVRRIAREQPLAAVLADVVLPLSSGIDLACEIRQLQPDVPVLLVSGSPRAIWRPEWVQKAGSLPRGSVCLLMKPFTAQSLLACIACVSNGTGGDPNCPIQELALDAAARPGIVEP